MSASPEASVARPLCADTSRAAGEDMTATASRVEAWVLVEYGGLWPYRPLDAAPFAGRLRDQLARRLDALPRSRLLLVKKPGRRRDERIRVVLARTPERGAVATELELGAYSELLDLDLARAFAGPLPGRRLTHPLLLVCTHGKRDRCCARYGQPVCEALHDREPRSWLWQASHVGGDRFAANVVSLPEGFYFGRVGSDDVARLLTAYREGRLPLDLFRGRAAYPFPVQAAEAAVRLATGLDGFWDLRFLGVARLGPDAWRVRLSGEVSGAVHEVEVAREDGEPAYLTCGAEHEAPARRFVARSVRQLP